MRHTPLAALLSFAAAALFVSLARPVQAADAKRPNILVMLVDDMGVMDTSVPFLTDENGTPKKYPLNEYYRTPSMERLAKQGVRFNQFYAMSVCSPTRCSIMTGQNAARHRTTQWINPNQNNRGEQGPPEWNWTGLKKADATLPRLLQAAGYKTIHAGKGHFGPRDSEGEDPRNLGFDVNIAGFSGGAPGSYYGQQDYGNKVNAKNGKRSNNAVPSLEKYHGTDTFLTEALTIEAKAAVTAAVKEEQPFFLYFPQYAVHAPFNSDPRFAAHYADSGKPANAQAFATLIEGMDKSLGDMLDHLKELQVAENTLVIFLGDNGSDAPLGPEHEVACAAPLRGKKGAHYEGGMRVPFIAAWGQANAQNPLQRSLPIAAGKIQSQPAAVYDLFPTILALAGVQKPAAHSVDGSSLATLLSGQADPQHDESFLMHFPHSPHRSEYYTVYRQGDWKVIYHYPPSKKFGKLKYELFNLKQDPFESTNLAEQEPAQLRRLMQGMIEKLAAQKAVFPVAEDGRTELRPELPEG
ncbi:sulfatase [Anatilimnocola sp. NA78]|uniref:sulfatase n=1 Tax=Anatilimnocola sp. NA78 TaxID=3415683 RepID=UPI003CE4F5D8